MTAAVPTIWGVDVAVFAAWAQVGGALITFAAVVVALWVAIRDGRHRERDHQEELAGQARTITVDLDSGHDDLLGRFYAVVVHNHSNAPITDITVVDVYAVFDGQTQDLLWRIEDGREPPPQICRVLPGGERCGSIPVEFTSSSDKWAPGPRPSYLALLHSVVTCAFTDARGIRWQRKGNEQPQRVRERWQR
ncbi:hypothetical protein [Haloechinothrix salitolerans]|uniref:Uncharacterized protein n=1 Tax=Haloechinothrix salitolerans TaxID=926830 RepID=A0ABW2C7V7_9PSEU